jgi:hypothetical protein
MNCTAAQPRAADLQHASHHRSEGLRRCPAALTASVAPATLMPISRSGQLATCAGQLVQYVQCNCTSTSSRVPHVEMPLLRTRGKSLPVCPTPTPTRCDTSCLKPVCRHTQQQAVNAVALHFSRSNLITVPFSAGNTTNPSSITSNTTCFCPTLPLAPDMAVIQTACQAANSRAAPAAHTQQTGMCVCCQQHSSTLACCHTVPK